MVFAGQRLRRTHRAGQSWLARRCARILFCYWTWQVSNAQKFLALALSRWEGIEKDLKLVSEKRREAIQRGDKEEERKWEQERKEAIEEFDKAREEATKAREELEKARSTAPLQAGDAFALLCSSCSPPLLVVGVMLSSQQGFRSSLSCFHCVGLQHFGEWPVLRSLSRLRLFLFEARLSGYCVREGESRESTLRSSRLPLAHGPCRAVGFRQDECRPGGLLRGHAFGL